MTATSAVGVLSLLDEQSNDLKIYALNQLNAIVDLYWAEVADQVSKIEILYEDKAFAERHLAALVASKVYYHLGEYNESLTFALGSANLFDLNMKSEYVETIISKAIDKYIELRVQQSENPSVQVPADLETVVQKMFQRCFDSQHYHQAIGISLESMRLDMLEASIVKGNPAELLAYVLESAMTVVENLNFRNKVLHLLVDLYKKLSVPDYISISQCLVHLNDPAGAAEMIKGLVSSGTDVDLLMAYQVAFDIEDNATQEFSIKVKALLPKPEVAPASAPAPTSDPNDMAVDEQAPLLSQISPTNWVVVGQNAPFAKLHEILSGTISIKLYLEFLYKNNQTDLLILKNTKGHLDKSAALLAPYLPQEGVSGSAYSEGGALFALGLIHANHGTSVLPALKKALKNSNSSSSSAEVLQHGAALGLGVAGMATGDEEIYESLRDVLYNDSAVAGEAAGIAMGLVMLGTANATAIDEMLQYAHETQHEKIIRGLSLGMSMIMFGQEENADVLIERLCEDKDPILRYGGIYTVAMAYAGTGNNKAIKRLLHVAVSDVNDDVRRAAVTGLGFLLFKTPQHVPRTVQLLSESYNPHVRYGATLALGISCAGTAMPEALDILEPMTKDNVDYVRQGALIALGMVLVQHNEASCPRSVKARKLYETIIADKREDILARLGATLGQGIIDAGGRNVTISLQSRSGYANIPAIVGMAVFTQFWYWYPLAHFLSLAFTPTGMIGLNKNLEPPHFQFMSNARPSLFAYPPATKPPTTEIIEKVATAVLSTTVKSKARAKKKDADAMELDEKKPEASPVEEKKDEEAEKKQKKKKEESFEVLDNFSRIVPNQAKYISFLSDSRYAPIKKQLSGIVILQDKTPNEPENLITLSMKETPATTTGTPANPSGTEATTANPTEAQSDSTPAAS